MSNISQTLEQCPAPPGYFVRHYPNSPSTAHIAACRRRDCDFCGKLWRNSWLNRLGAEEKQRAFDGKPPAVLMLTLTTAYQADYKQVYAALRYFWQEIRKRFPAVEYWGVVEFNQNHTQPHLHFLLANTKFIEYRFIRSCWETAQRWAKFEKIAFIERIEKIRASVPAYMLKYLTKLTGGKDEIPRREMWQGRFVRYSRKFFSWKATEYQAFLRWQYFSERLSSDPDFELYTCEFFRLDASVKVNARIDSSTEIARRARDALSFNWSPTADAARARSQENQQLQLKEYVPPAPLGKPNQAELKAWLERARNSN